LTALACVLLLALVVLPQANPTHRTFLVRTLEWRPLIATGVASYSLFLWHEPVVRHLEARGWTSVGTVGFLSNLVVVAVISGGLAALTYSCVERPALRRRNVKVADAPSGLQSSLAHARAVPHRDSEASL
jgi:peptidoglycan/LPS O-acetylase OafA/YrhL